MHHGVPTQSGMVEISRDSLHKGATHWSAMLDDIDELRNVLRDHDDVNNSTDPSICDGDEVLFGSAKKPLLFHQVLSQFLPPRQEVDRLVGAYFRTKIISAPFLHTTQFRRLYQAFWDNPASASPLWASILFSVLDISTRLLSPSLDVDEQKLTYRFGTAAAHCLVVGAYHRPQKFSVEALLLYAHAKCLRGADLGPDVAIILGIIVRMATIMGYHRDANGSRGKISAFEGEMRRRTWSLCMQLDMLISFQLGLPSNIQYPTWDTRPPTNLLDSDFDEDTLQLPPARSPNEPTELLFYIAKHRLMMVFEKVIRHTLAAFDRPQKELEAIDKEIRDTFADLPHCFQARSMEDSIVDSPSVTVTRLCVYFIYHKSLCVLHRKYVARGRTSSLQICYTSATDLVTRFLDMYKEFEPGGQLETERWFLGSLTWHDFLLACTAICLCICYTKQHTDESTIITIVDVTASLNLLQDANVVLQEQSSRRQDTNKVRRLIEATTLKCGYDNNGRTSVTQTPFHNDQVETSEAYWQTMVPSQSDDWSWSEGMTDSTDDSGWAFLEQFLGSQNQDVMIPGMVNDGADQVVE
ncbi:hypothetical protein NHQ30_003511 [Ciborinia camelliae]|nr:hypothetical protein NHQ30_003511 [Ciborinia camelliae]